MTSPEKSETPESRFILPSDTTLDQLVQRLIQSGIPIEEYGTGDAKTVNHLLSELNEGEAIISVDAKGNMHRDVNVLWVDVICRLPDGRTFYLEEDRQEFKDGRTKRRHLESSIGEKLKPHEDPETAVGRALNEELGIQKIESLYSIGYDEKTRIARTYPGLESTYRIYKYVTVIPEGAFTEDGFVEHQADKTNYYTWRLA